jgi:hypothetical protein
MNDDDLKKLWQQQPLRNPPSATLLISAMQKQTTQLRSTLDARDIRELVACAVVIIIFGIFYFTVYLEPIPRLGDLIVMGARFSSPGKSFTPAGLLRPPHPARPPSILCGRN